jgi:hypothetical protein
MHMALAVLQRLRQLLRPHSCILQQTVLLLREPAR